MIAYSLLTGLLWPLLLIYTVRIGWRDKSLRYVQQRLGFGYPEFSRRPIWLHCASVGEVNTLRPLLERLIERYPAQRFVLTTSTVGGAAMVSKHGFARCQHCFLPIDTVGAVKRFLRQLQPRLALVMETELWPQLYRQCHRQGIPISLINARLSHRTLDSHAWIRARYRDALQQVDHVLCRTAADQQAFVRLGLAEKRSEIIGNLKFAQPITTAVEPIDELRGRPYVLAASTHDNEEYQLADIWRRMGKQAELLVIAPRHPHRAAAIMQQLGTLKLKVAQRSLGDALTDDTQIYLADTLGELGRFIAGAELVFIGGSLVPHGGQNLLEPASFGKAIITGPHMENFAAETALLLSRQACIQLSSGEQLAATLQRLLADRELQKHLGEQARAVMQSQAAVVQNYLQVIEGYYGSLLAAADDVSAS